MDTKNTVSNTNYDGYRWVRCGTRDIHCRYINEPDLVQYTPVLDEDGLWVKTVYNNARVEWSERQPS